MNSFFSKTYSILANNILLKLIYLLSSFIFVTSLSNITNISILTKISISFAILLIPIGVISSIKDFKNNKLVYILVYSFLISNLILVFYNYPSIENIKSCIINSILLLVFFSVWHNLRCKPFHLYFLLNTLCRHCYYLPNGDFA